MLNTFHTFNMNCSCMFCFKFQWSIVCSWRCSNVFDVEECCPLRFRTMYFFVSTEKSVFFCGQLIQNYFSIGSCHLRADGLTVGLRWTWRFISSVIVSCSVHFGGDANDVDDDDDRRIILLQRSLPIALKELQTGNFVVYS